MGLQDFNPGDTLEVVATRCRYATGTGRMILLKHLTNKSCLTNSLLFNK